MEDTTSDVRRDLSQSSDKESCQRDKHNIAIDPRLPKGSGCLHAGSIRIFGCLVLNIWYLVFESSWHNLEGKLWAKPEETWEEVGIVLIVDRFGQVKIFRIPSRT